MTVFDRLGILTNHFRNISPEAARVAEIFEGADAIFKW